MGLGIVVVETCTRNELSNLDLEQLETVYEEVAVMRTDCLNMCNLCRARPYALVNGNKVYEKTTSECYEQVEVVIQSELKDFYQY
ncbi:YuzB family protein [Paenibacillus endoradicis]|uniref:YuzB family protein n=1 Tax=Paenibacillus endoradicis TaxID=2972487 RepID=UPI002158FEC7|nr:YuzB family protein [Paenibacillus endoradicis]MCR8655969.1 YuzB family protein [Paenibacillus endoradicis]MCR8658295.1 YuzB family protein [Paenibacillus endoradicis]